MSNVRDEAQLINNESKKQQMESQLMREKKKIVGVPGESKQRE